MTQLTAIALIASDLDGTLLRTDGVITERMVRALRAWEARGGIFVAATGRPPRTAYPVARDLDLRGPLICCNGALTLDLATLAILRHTPLAPELALATMRALRAAAPAISFAVEREWELEFEPGYHQLRPLAAGTLRPNLEALGAVPVTKLLAIHPTLGPEALCALATDALGDRILATHSGLPLAEICAAGVSKASALAALCAARGMPQTATAACGDMPNDLDLLRWVGVSVAVANAHPAMRAVASVVTAANDDDGVARFIEATLAAQASGDDRAHPGA